EWKWPILASQRTPNAPAAATPGSSRAAMSGPATSPVSSTPGSNRTTTSPLAASSPRLAAWAQPSGGRTVRIRTRSPRLPASRSPSSGLPELSTRSASKSWSAVCSITPLSQRSTSSGQPCTSASIVNARAAGASSTSLSNVPSRVSTSSQPASLSCWRIRSAATKSRAWRRLARRASSCSASCRSMTELLLALPGFDRLGQLGQDLQRVADDAQVGHLQDWRVTILVDGDDHLRTLHAHRMLHGAGDSGRYVHARPDGLTCLTHLHGVRHPAGIDDCPAGASCAAQGVCKLVHEVEVLGTTQATTPGPDDPCVLQLDLVSSLFKTIDDARSPGPPTDRGSNFDHLSLVAALAHPEC